MELGRGLLGKALSDSLDLLVVSGLLGLVLALGGLAFGHWGAVDASSLSS